MVLASRTSSGLRVGSASATSAQGLGEEDGSEVEEEEVLWESIRPRHREGPWGWPRFAGTPEKDEAREGNAAGA